MERERLPLMTTFKIGFSNGVVYAAIMAVFDCFSNDPFSIFRRLHGAFFSVQIF